VHIRTRRHLARVLAAIALLVAIVAAITIFDPFAAGAQDARRLAGTARTHSAPSHNPRARSGQRLRRRARSRRAPRATARAADGFTEQFSLLSQPSDGPPPAAVMANIERAPAFYGLEATMARQADDGTWLIPGAAWSCIAVTTDGVGVACAPNAAVEVGELRFTVVDRATGEEQITGVVPDGPSSVKALAADGSTLATAQITDNMYELGVRDAARLQIE
jgi:hypothetical protein